MKIPVILFDFILKNRKWHEMAMLSTPPRACGAGEDLYQQLSMQEHGEKRRGLKQANG